MFTLNIKINHLYHTYLLIIFLKRNKAKCIVWNVFWYEDISPLSSETTNLWYKYAK